MAELRDPPPAPGSIGVAIESRLILEYLSAVMKWRDELRDVLDALDKRALIAETSQALTADMTLSMALWQSIANRIDELVAKWDNGRVLRKEREEISQLIWGRLDRSTTGLPVSFVEACVLVTALARQLEDRIEADALAGSSISGRIGPMREQLARCRSRLGAAGSSATVVDQLQAELDAIVDRLADGEAVEAAFDALDLRVHALERDLIVGTARRQSIERDAASLTDRLARLEALEMSAREVAATCREKILHPPKMAVPDVTALEQPPTGMTGAGGRAELDRYLTRLARVERALNEVLAAYRRPLDERDALRGMLESYRAMAGHRGVGEDPRVTEVFADAKAVLWSAPCDLERARELVATFQQLARGGRRAEVIEEPPVPAPAMDADVNPGTVEDVRRDDADDAHAPDDADDAELWD